MFVTDKLIYIQLHKTGCTHIAHLLSKYIGGQQLKKHSWLQNYNTTKTIIGSIRNPWDWYVSLWAFGCKKEGYIYNETTRRYFLFLFLLLSKFRQSLRYKEPYFDINDLYSHFKNEVRKSTKIWQKTYENNTDSKCFRNWLNLINNPKRKIDFQLGYNECSISKFAGLMTYRYCTLYLKDFFLPKNFKGIKTLEELKNFDKKNNLTNYFIKTENLEEDFLNILEKIGYNLDKATIESIKNSGKTNISSHYNTGFYYDKETINFVAEKEKFIIEKFGYSPPKLINKTNE